MFVTILIDFRQGVKESVELCHVAGIKVIMITGDHISTAVAIAKQLSIIQETDEESVIQEYLKLGYRYEGL